MMNELQLPSDDPVLPDDPIDKVKAALELTGEVTIKVPANQLALVTHALFVGLSHPQFDYGDNVAAIEQLTEQWSGDLGRKIPGLMPLFEADLLMVADARRSRKIADMPPLPGTIKELKPLAKKLGIKNYWAMKLEELVGSIEQYNPVVIREALSDG
jgi:hypothetical protein